MQRFKNLCSFLGVAVLVQTAILSSAQDINECQLSTHNCSLNAACDNMEGSFACTCYTGYSGDGFADGTGCTDVDECNNTTLNTCEQICNNTMGSFWCDCYPGYIFNLRDKTKCEDYNECNLGLAGCQQLCVNTPGSFQCDCYHGYSLNDDGITCSQAFDPCSSYPEFTCSDTCRVIDQQAVCSCGPGFMLGADNRTCIDVNECGTDDLNLCTEKETCRNTNGSYVCSCSQSFKLDNDQRTCSYCDSAHWGDDCEKECNCGVGRLLCDTSSGCQCLTGWTGTLCDKDVDECRATVNPCTQDKGEVCVNNRGSFACVCPDGFMRDSANACIDIDECSSTAMNDCDQNCQNYQGGYTCRCTYGYTHNGTSCNDVDECGGNYDCDDTCINTEGLYACNCSDGYSIQADGKECKPTLACSLTCNANEYCFKSDNNAAEQCICNRGYERDFDTNQCIEKPECNQASNPCTHGCDEVTGAGYTCTCDTGFRLDQDQATCIECQPFAYGVDCLQCDDCDVDHTESCHRVTGACNCLPGWTGTTCDTDIDECETQAEPCVPNANCTNTDGSFVCRCNDGFVFDSDGNCSVCGNKYHGTDCESSCLCRTTNTAACNNVNGECTCRPGWTGSTCETDINECNDPDPCNNTLKSCDNTDGSFMCDCIEGYTLDAQETCNDNDECLMGTDDCLQKCTNVPGSFNCSCYSGNEGTGNSCTACAVGKYGVQCAETCHCNNTTTIICDSVWGCVCDAGWTGINCTEDINECTDNAAICPDNSDCTNSNGSFSCVCHTGFTMDEDGYCIECANNTYGVNCSSACNCVNQHSVDPSQSCNRINGVCECQATWNGTQCELDIDECTDNTDQCETVSNRGCNNFPGGFNCSCLRGFELNNGICISITEPSTAPTAQANELKSTITITFGYVIPVTDDLTVTGVFNYYVGAVTTGLTTYFHSSMGGISFRRVVITDVTRGSIITTASVFILDADSSRNAFAEAVSNLALNPDASVTILGQVTKPQRVQLEGDTADLRAYSETDIKCAILFSIVGQCPSNEECWLERGHAVCKVSESSDSFGLVMGLGVGIPLAVTVFTIGIVLILIATKKAITVKRSSTGNGRGVFTRTWFPSGIRTRVDSWKRRSAHMHSQQTYDNTSFPAWIEDRHHPQLESRDNHERGNYANDDYDKSNFSWDFMHKYVNPNERYGIQRPQLGRTQDNVHRMSKKW